MFSGKFRESYEKFGDEVSIKLHLRFLMDRDEQAGDGGGTLFS